ncbi:MAG: DsrE family protein [Anaerolineae bacterium]|nr:DsrE family protein [Anaerolineae bacterium]
MAFDNELTVLWTTDNLVTTRDMVFMYAGNAKRLGWFEHVNLVIWGASAVLAAENGEVQGWLRELMDAGVDVYACKACADRHGASEALAALGVVVAYMGQPLTERLKAGAALLTV